MSSYCIDHHNILSCPWQLADHQHPVLTLINRLQTSPTLWVDISTLPRTGSYSRPATGKAGGGRAGRAAQPA